MEINGIIVKMLEPTYGEGKKGAWAKQDVIIQHNNHPTFPKSMSVTFFNKMDLLDGIAEGQEVEIKFDIECREYNGKYYNDIKGWGIDVTNGVAHNPQKQEQASPPPPADFIMPEEDKDSLPF